MSADSPSQQTDYRTVYTRQYRATRAGQTALGRQAQLRRAREAAIRRLIHLHENEFERLLAEERYKLRLST